MTEDTNNITTGRLRSFDRAVRIKWNKYIGSGTIILIIGILVLILTLMLAQTGSTSSALLLGLGVLLIIIGIVRLLIGIITPATPLDTAPEPAENLEQELFQDTSIPTVDPGSE
ncbi:MAG TPA: hypothetical protein VL485_00990 [Ktedonobacteraceae bacterium]|jgi:hypothetical protein|nr:hypothetical protein [Ktedonobacteraceae bacterium]